MRRFGSLTLECLLLVASLSHDASAARPSRQKGLQQQQQQPSYILPPLAGSDTAQKFSPEDLGEKEFTLRHIYHHGTHLYPNLHRFKDISPDAQVQVTDDYGETLEPAPRTLRARVASSQIQRMTDRSRARVDDLLEHSYYYGVAEDLPSSAWTVDTIPGPNYTDKETVLSFAKMAANAYVSERDDSEWMPVGGGFNYTDDFGWRKDGLRGHIFADTENKTIVIGLKGTSPALFDGADTTGNDKLNDNLFGSCCCGQGGSVWWKKVCDCMTSAYTCNNTCLVQNLREKSHYYWAVRDLYHNVTERYPGSDVWLSGHSLGGVVSSLLALTYGLPTMTFEAYPDALAASRLGLPTPPGYRIGSHQSRDLVSIHHFGHTADPIFMGTCNTAGSFCTLWGYAFQGLCHTGKTCQYDTVGDFGWRQGVGTHRINSVIRDVIEKYDTVPTCEEDTDCQDCTIWKFFESNGTETTTSKTSTSTSTSTSSSLTRTRTETCKTPGWWGCLDETTTAQGSTTLTSTLTETTCLTPGWFGCNDGSTTITTTTTITTPISAPASTTSTFATSSSSLKTTSSTTTCKTPGWFGCNDPTSTSTSIHPDPTTSTSSSSRTSETCTSKEWFGLICVDPSPTTGWTQPTESRPTKQKHTHCVERHWWGSCQRRSNNDREYQYDLR
ncbi:alpha/beta-hydrolase [Polychaeton citri CBS 116435]|uniref:triacylglycerol lipase n=1 Tax=Polychaeton citri CBS 116435 TaxID=1314669 RepID=A0A9P4UTN0_9PEZI|nr:alpha/beta-hydrolase [Polychaeton citri CBS 116435]